MILTFLKRAGAIFGLLIFATIVALSAPSVGQILAVALIGISGWALYRPFPRFGFGHRAFSTALLLLVALPSWFIATEERKFSDPAYMASLRTDDPVKYLARLERQDRELWLQEAHAMQAEAQLGMQSASVNSQAHMDMAAASSTALAKAEESAKQAQDRATEAQRKAAVDNAARQAEAERRQAEAQRQAQAAAAKAKEDRFASDLASLREKVDTLDYQAARAFMNALNADGREMEAIRAEMEAKVLSFVTDLPEEEAHMAEKGYALLAAIRSENLDYPKKAKATAQAMEAKAKAAVGRMRQTVDKVDGITWHNHPNAPKHLNSRSTAFLYVGQNRRAEVWLRMRVQYAASDWLFVNRVYAWVDGAKHPLIQGAFMRDNNTTIWEWMDVTPDEHQLFVLDQLARGKEAILRFEGDQYSRDVTLSVKDKKAILETVQAFRAMQAGVGG